MAVGIGVCLLALVPYSPWTSELHQQEHMHDPQVQAAHAEEVAALRRRAEEAEAAAAATREALAATEAAAAAQREEAAALRGALRREEEARAAAEAVGCTLLKHGSAGRHCGMGLEVGLELPSSEVS